MTYGIGGSDDFLEHQVTVNFFSQRDVFVPRPILSTPTNFDETTDKCFCTGGHVLQERQFERVGEDTTRKVDVRIIAATNKDLGAEAAAKRFRQDLYYRLSVFPIEIPPLRQIIEDIPALADHFVSHFRSRLNRPEIRLTKADTELLKRCDWPGNVRELQNVIERAMILSTGTRLRLDLALTQTRSDKQTGLPVDSSAMKIVRGDDLKRIERESIVTALERAHWRISGVAQQSF